MKKQLLLITVMCLLTLVGCQSGKQQNNTDQQTSNDISTVYFLFVDRFLNGNPDNDHNYNRKYDYGSEKLNAATFHGGDIAGVTQKLKEGFFSDLGVEAIWVTGVYEQIHGWVGGGSKNDFPHYAYHGYYPMDLTSMDRNFGTIKEFRTFVDLAHAKGIKVIMDAGLNHPGYATLLDAVQFDFGGVTMTEVETREHIAGWEYKNLFSPANDAQWNNWWDASWTRTADEVDKDLLTESIAGLPDFRTESTTPVNIPVFLKKKWARETADDQAWVNPSTLPLRKDLKLAPADYIMQWQVAWVREFGLDGFRCDVVENVDMFRWKQLNEACNKALKEWRTANPDKPGADWNQDFWMTGDIWDSGYEYRPTCAAAGFNSIVNFTFPKDGNLATIGAIWQNYADSLNSNNNWNTLSFANNTYKRDTDPDNMINVGTTLLLAPGAVQIFYGDEAGRRVSDGQYTSDPIQGYRSDYKWGTNPHILKHWQMLGQFRRRHPAVSKGKQVKLANQTFLRSMEGDKIIIRLGDTGAMKIHVKGAFEDGTKVRNACNGEVALVDNGTVEFTANNNLILIEEVK
ncbi:alpha-amylase [Marinilabiliaceae bacterium JC017]|nr:alpha-amylase [Marinilabiliaceae bacterium JC017]